MYVMCWGYLADGVCVTYIKFYSVLCSDSVMACSGSYWSAWQYPGQPATMTASPNQTTSYRAPPSECLPDPYGQYATPTDYFRYYPTRVCYSYQPVPLTSPADVVTSSLQPCIPHTPRVSMGIQDYYNCPLKQYSSMGPHLPSCRFARTRSSCSYLPAFTSLLSQSSHSTSSEDGCPPPQATYPLMLPDPKTTYPLLADPKDTNPHLPDPKATYPLLLDSQSASPANPTSVATPLLPDPKATYPQQPKSQSMSSADPVQKAACPQPADRHCVSLSSSPQEASPRSSESTSGTPVGCSDVTSPGQSELSKYTSVDTTLSDLDLLDNLPISEMNSSDFLIFPGPNSYVLNLRAPLRKRQKKVHACAVCGATFRHRSTYNTHQNVHSGAKPYTCNICQRAFGDRSTHIKHLRTHTGIRPYQCKDCGKAFTQSGNLIRHRKSVHKLI